MRRLFRRILSIYRTLARRLAFVPLRIPGFFLALAGGAVAWWVGKAQADYLLFPAGIGAVALVALCSVCVTLGMLRVRSAVRRLPAGVPEVLETTHAARTGFRFPRLAWWPLLEVRMAWETPATVEVELEADGSSWEEVITPRERGRHPRLVRRFTVVDVFGLTAASFTVGWNEPVRIAPACATIGADLAVSYGYGDAFSHPAGRQEGDLVEMRAYGHGDPMRHILWKTYARSRRLLVRMPERAIAPSPTTVAFLVAGPGDEPTCATARLYLERNMFGPDFLFSADGAAAPTRHTHEAVDQIIDSIHARGDRGSSLESLSAQVERTRLTSCVVFAPAIDGAWRERVTAFCGRLPSPPTVIIGVDGVSDPRRRRLLSRLLTRTRTDVDADSRAFAAVPALRAALEADGMRVQVIHRKTGQVL